MTEETIELDGQPVFLRRAGNGEVPILYLHGIGTSSHDWLAPLELGGGIAVDLPGFGRSGKRGDLDYSLAGHVAFLDRLLGELGIERVRLCLHDWGAAVGLRWAIAQPQRVQRLVVVNGVPLLAGFRWRGPARLVRAPLVGQVAVGAATRPVLRRLWRRASGGGAPMPADLLADVSANFDLGTERAILRLLRSATPESRGAGGAGGAARAAPAARGGGGGGAAPESLADAGAGLAAIDAPALVLWGARDPWIPQRFGAGYAATLGDATLEVAEDAGHWPWIDQPRLAARIVEHLEG